MAISASSSSSRRRCSMRAADAASSSASSTAGGSAGGSGWGAGAAMRADLDICRYRTSLHIARQEETLQNDGMKGDAAQGKVLRDWIDSQLLVRFEARILPVDTAVALRCARLHIPDPRAERDALIARHRPGSRHDGGDPQSEGLRADRGRVAQSLAQTRRGVGG